MFAPENKCIWDFWLVQDGADWHLFFLEADAQYNDLELCKWQVSIGHAVSTDLRDWRYLGTCFAPESEDAWDDYTTWTGSTIKGGDGKWHMFYTGTKRAEEGMKQRILHATSTDLHNWTRTSKKPIVDIDPAIYEEYSPGHWHDRAFRDPWVIRDPAGAGWLMYFTARVPGLEEPNAGGVVGLARSDNLYEWTLHPPVYAGGDFGQLEVPQVLKLGEKWYCLFCTTGALWSKKYAASYDGTPVNGTHYLMADDPLGPWTVAPGPFLDGDVAWSHYSGKLVPTDKGLFFLAFVNADEHGKLIGKLSAPVPVDVGPDGLLALRRPIKHI